MFKKVAVGISGGVDSSIAALLLKRKGFNVQGVFMQNWDIRDEKGVCSSEEDFKDAQFVCNKLGIKLNHVNFVKQYWNEVFCDLIKEYESGNTPNPDILCNRNIKFNYFYKYAIGELGCDAIATGHYANSSFGRFLEKYESNKAVKLLLAKDSKKDQTFFLCQVRQEMLRKTMFPLGNLTKLEVKQLAVDNDLERIASKPESMGICFIGSRNFQDFIKEYIPDKSGDFVDIDTGKVVGKHEGIHKWTLGQRTRISGLPVAYFVGRKYVENNIIYVASGTDHSLLHSDLFFTGEPHWIHSEPSELQCNYILECNFKFQHTENWKRCQICKIENGLVVKLDEEMRALTNGQYAVFSKNGECLGSAKIKTTPISRFSYNYDVNKYKEKSETEIITEQI
ncbi:mitochondrial tRNA-specific 2-thiouridylase 1 [Diorhabda carinulata]|uniref:mitochondrial tRNA-specific 2-thiouridylase 1 n=1 Tax=Diorhabda carinulata TaxID=1163345 RepID=UPI0025A2E30B|nr:mitochondrial tRNA-specific 2-thiouridylase 1 [Diorhabda carinulata]